MAKKDDDLSQGLNSALLRNLQKATQPSGELKKRKGRCEKEIECNVSEQASEPEMNRYR